MPRPPRLEFADAVYHVMSRGNARKRIFYGNDDRQRFLSQLQDNLLTHDAVLYAYVLMPNHYHLLVQTRRADLGRFMQRLNTSYALYFRYKHRAPGHVLQGRYRAKLVEEDDYMVPLSRYIHLNPVRSAARRSNKRQRLKLLAECPHSSYRGYVSKQAEEPWVCYDLLQHFGSSSATARRHYRAYVDACLTDDDRPLQEVMRASRYAIGSEAFVRKIERTLKQARIGRPADRDLDLPRPRVDLELISRVVAEAFDVDVGLLTQHGRRAGPAKAVALELACRLTELSQRAIGEHYGKITSMAVCMARRRLKEDPRYTTPATRRRIAEIESTILARAEE